MPPSVCEQRFSLGGQPRVRCGRGGSEGGVALTDRLGRTESRARTDAAPGAAGDDTGRLVPGLLLAAGTLLLVALAFPPVGWWPLSWVAFDPMVVAQHRVLPAGRSGLAVGLGIGG